VYERTELPAGRSFIEGERWTRHEVTADLAPDAIYIKVKAMVTGRGAARIANISITP